VARQSDADAILQVRLGALREGLHVIRCEAAVDRGAATGFVLSQLVARRPSGTIVWVTEAAANVEAGFLSGHGLNELGLGPDALLIVNVDSVPDVFLALEEAIASQAIGGAVADFTGKTGLPLTSTRRISLRLRGRSIPVFLLIQTAAMFSTTAFTHWRVAGDRASHQGISIGWRLQLDKNRGGPTGSWRADFDSVACSLRASRGRNASAPIASPALKPGLLVHDQASIGQALVRLSVERRRAKENRLERS